MQPLRESIFKTVIVENYVCCRLSTFVSGGVSLSKAGKVINHHKDILIASFATLQVDKVYGNQFKWLGGFDGDKIRFDLSLRLPLL